MEALKEYQQKKMDGEDANGNQYNSIEDLWRKELDP